jgi:hypothetical protein
VNAEAKDLDEQVNKEAAPIPQSPCVGCRHELRCKSANLACERFVLFKRFGASPERLAFAPCQPSATIYARAHAPIKATPAPAVYRRPVSDDEAMVD